MRIKPKKSLGQNFLIDKNIIKKITETYPISNESEILEIGPGTGNLTEFFLKKEPKKIFLIEKDKNLYLDLKKKFNKIEVINDDILKLSLKKIVTEKTIVFGNLPYNISSQILTRFILNKENLPLKVFIFMFQKELADRIIAKPNTSCYGRLTILTNWKFKVKKLFDISPNSFFPKPKVTSTLLFFKMKENFNLFKEPETLGKITKIFFNQRRKKIKNQLKKLFDNYEEIAENLSIDLNCRPQNLKPEVYYNLVHELEKLR